MPTRNYSAEKYHRSFNLCRFHATPCARSSHARADMHAAAGEVDAKLEETIYRSSVLPSTAPCQCVITQPIFSQIILPLQIPCHTMRALVPCQCSRGHATCRAPYLVLMLLTALTPPLFPQGEARAAAEAKAQPLAPRQVLPPPARSKRTTTPKNKKEAKVSY